MGPPVVAVAGPVLVITRSTDLAAALTWVDADAVLLAGLGSGSLPPIVAVLTMVPAVVGSVGVKTAVRLCVPTVSELVEVVAVPAVTLTAGPRLAALSWNWTLPAATVGLTLAVRLTVVPAVCGLAGAAVSVVLVLVGAAGAQQVCVQVLPVTWMSARHQSVSVPDDGPLVMNRIW